MPLKAIATTNALPIALMYTCAPQEYCSRVWLQPWAGGKEKAQPKGHDATDALLDVSLKPLRNRWVCPLKSLLSSVLVPLSRNQMIWGHSSGHVAPELSPVFQFGDERPRDANIPARMPPHRNSDPRCRVQPHHCGRRFNDSWLLG